MANLPYYVTTPILMQLLEQKNVFTSITVMVQKEVADRIRSGPGSKEYGALSLAVQYFAEPEAVLTVPPSCFIPCFGGNNGRFVVYCDEYRIEALKLDKYELKVTIGEIDTLIAKRRLREAAEIADTVDWRRVKNVRTLCRVSDVYKINRRYEDSKRILELAYAKNPYGRQIIFSLCELELKLGNYVRALQLYNEYINVAPRDPDRYVLQYKLYKEQDVSVNERIAVLEEMARHDLRDRWAFELAKLYLEAGERSACESQCDEIVAFFGDGKYVLKALELKASFSELTVRQKALYRKMTGQEEEEPELPEQAPGKDRRGTFRGTGSGTESSDQERRSDRKSEGGLGRTDRNQKAPEQEHREAPDRETSDQEAPTGNIGSGNAGPGSTGNAGSTRIRGAPDPGKDAGHGSADREASDKKAAAIEIRKAEEDIPVLNREPLMTEIPWEYEDYKIRTRELKKEETRGRNGESGQRHSGKEQEKERRGS